MEEENKIEETKEDVLIKTKSEVEKIIKQIVENGLLTENIELLYKLIDIHKDIENEKYWKEKEENMMYRDYDNYGGGRSRDSRGRYMESGSYGRRGVPGTGRGRYRGEEMMDEMYRAYNDYMDSAEYGNYGTNESMMKIEIMADSLMDFVEHLRKEAKTPEERQLIDQKLQELSRM